MGGGVGACLSSLNGFYLYIYIVYTSGACRAAGGAGTLPEFILPQVEHEGPDHVQQCGVGKGYEEVSHS